jgi:phosphate transport system permease protein
MNLTRRDRRRRRADRVAHSMLVAVTLVTLAPLVLVLGYVIERGIGAWSVAFFTQDPSGRFLGDPGGVRSAIIGTLEIVVLAMAIALPLGIAVAVYLVEVSSDSPFARTVRAMVDVLTGVPSIVCGLLVYVVLVLHGGVGGFAAWKGAVALALLVLPVVARGAEVVLEQVPAEPRQAAYALGARDRHVIGRVVLPAAIPGLTTVAMLAVARAAGETAPLLFTVLGAKATTLDPGAQMNALPLQVFNDVREAQDRLVQRAWGAALVLIVLVLLASIAGRLAARRAAVES